MEGSALTWRAKGRTNRASVDLSESPTMHTDWFSAEHNRGRDHLGPGAAYRELCDALPLFVWVLDASGAAVYANRPFLAYTGMQPGDVRGDGLLSALHPEDRAHTTTALMDAVRTGSDFTLEQRVRSRE